MNDEAEVKGAQGDVRAELGYVVDEVKKDDRLLVAIRLSPEVAIDKAKALLDAAFRARGERQ